MDAVNLQKAIALIAKGLEEKERLLEKAPSRYPHSAKLQHGINMFLTASYEPGGLGNKIFEYADESSFLDHYACIPIADWFCDWEPEAIRKLNLEDQPFYGYDAFAYRRGPERYVPSEACTEFLETQEANIVEGTDEYALFEKLCRVSQENYVFVRRFIIEHPVLTIHERREIFMHQADSLAAKDAVTFAYESFHEKMYRCPVCGWTMASTKYGPVCHSTYCTEKTPALNACDVLDGAAEPLYRLRKGIMRYFAQPGKLELQIASFCEKANLAYELWPQMDTYDVAIKFPNNVTWAIDAKAYRNPVSLKNWIRNRGGFPEGDYEKAFYVIPTEYARGNRSYTRIMNQALSAQPNVRCVTLNKLKSLIRGKEREIHAE